MFGFVAINQLSWSSLDVPDLAALPPFSVSYSFEENSYRQDLFIRAETIKGISTVVSALVLRERDQVRMPMSAEDQASVCATNMKGQDNALYLYAATHKDKYPDAARWREVLIEEDYAPKKVFICPTLGGDPEKDNHYVFVPWPWPNQVDGNFLVIIERKANHSGQRNVVCGDHGVRNVSEAEFQEMLAETIEALKTRGIEFNWQE